jgi:large subunit ribosomal protein L21e
MVQRAGGFRCKTRHTLRKVPRTSGKVAVTRQLQQFNIGDAVTLAPEPAMHNGMPHPRYKNRTGKVIEKRGSSYVVKIRDGNSMKLLIAAPVHLRRVI